MKLKHFLFLFFLILLSSCEDIIVDEQVGCLSGIYPGTNTRQYILCITKSEFASSGNTFFGITYDNIIWTEVDDCDECATLDYDNL